MTTERYPNLLFNTLGDITRWIREVTRSREDDIEDFNSLKNKVDELPQAMIIVCSDETTAVVAGNAKVTFRMPFSFTLTSVKLSVTTAPTGATKLAVDLNAGGVSIFSTTLTLDAGEKTSATASVPAVLITTSLADDTEMTVDFDAVGSIIAGAGIKIYLIGFKT